MDDHRVIRIDDRNPIGIGVLVFHLIGGGCQAGNGDGPVGGHRPAVAGDVVCTTESQFAKERQVVLVALT